MWEIKLYSSLKKGDGLPCTWYKVLRLFLNVIEQISTWLRSNLQFKGFYKWLTTTVSYILDLNPFRYGFFCPGGVLLRSPVGYIWMDAQLQPGAVWVELRRGVLVLLVLHALKLVEQTRGRKAFDVDSVLICGCQGPGAAHGQWRWTE